MTHTQYAPVHYGWLYIYILVLLFDNGVHGDMDCVSAPSDLALFFRTNCILAKNHQIKLLTDYSLFFFL